LLRPSKAWLNSFDGFIRVADDTINGHILPPSARADKYHFPELRLTDSEQQYRNVTFNIAGNWLILYCLVETHKTFALAALHARMEKVKTQAQGLEQEYLTKREQLTS